jgi:dTDP-4-dehydrorhamnose reductase
VRILLTGATGQLGWEIAQLLAGHEVVAPGHAALDLADTARIREAVRAVRPDLIVNSAAYTAVDQAERDEPLARAINAEAPAVLAEEARRLGIALFHFSTDYVFDGRASVPYAEDTPTAPLNAYGRTKLEGEEAVAGSGCIHLILRTSWVYSRRGRNFLLTIERLARERPRLTIVADQAGTPNWARALARASVALAARPRDELSAKSGIYHLSSRGETTWHGFAIAIVESMRLESPPEVVPIRTSEYPTAATRPAYAVLDSSKLARSFGIVLPQWGDALGECQLQAVSTNGRGPA